ncbi:MAG: imidazole glycerol phosphate synthase subunit HisH [Epsilonproteobacteria bacterium]|nr:MAG: imidazole glycerol phosphate synthase subunit HisH [Campylobacterota bacterium]
MSYIAIIDYGLGNIQSISNALNSFGSQYILTKDKEKILNADGLILPGVGAFSEGMRLLKLHHLDSTIKEYAASNKPLLGICLGMQLLLEESEEFELTQGLDLIEGKVLKFPLKSSISLKLPHIGWSQIKHSQTTQSNSLLFDIPNIVDMYFVHSYIVVPTNRDHILSLSGYGDYEFCSSLQKRNIYGCQFHPEKSSKEGLKIVKNFINICKEKNYK